MGTRGAQPVSYNLRLPDAAQADALRLLDTSRAVINQALTMLWPDLDAFIAARSGPAWKQVDALLSSPAGGEILLYSTRPPRAPRRT